MDTLTLNELTQLLCVVMKHDPRTMIRVQAAFERRADRPGVAVIHDRRKNDDAPAPKERAEKLLA